MDADVAHPTRTLRAGRPADVRRGHLPLGEPAGTPDRIEVTSGRLERGGRPWFPVTGEVHFPASRGNAGPRSWATPGSAG